MASFTILRLIQTSEPHVIAHVLKVKTFHIQSGRLTLNLNTNNFTLVCSEAKPRLPSNFSIKTRNYFALLEENVLEKDAFIRELPCHRHN